MIDHFDGYLARKLTGALEMARDGKIASALGSDTWDQFLERRAYVRAYQSALTILSDELKKAREGHE